MKITLEIYDKRITLEIDHDDVSSSSLREDFERMMVVAGYSPIVITDDEGEYLFVGNDEVVITKEELSELEQLKGGDNER